MGKMIQTYEGSPIYGVLTLFKKESLRFWRVGFQTILAPVLTALLYLLVFSQVLENHVQVHGVPYVAFLGPGLVMMSILQNSFSNSSSSLIQSKVMNNLIFLLLSPISYQGLWLAYMAASVVRGALVGIGVMVVTLLFHSVPVSSMFWIIIFTILGGGLFASLGIIAGLWADKFDQLAAFQNFLILPLTFLSGVFYSIYSLPSFWQKISHFNPVFYLIDGFRYGFLGISDVSHWTSFWVTLACFGASAILSITLLKNGYKIRN